MLISNGEKKSFMSGPLIPTMQKFRNSPFKNNK